MANRAPFSDIEWYKLTSHPNPEFEVVIRRFARQIAENLGIDDPPIAWFRKAGSYITAGDDFNKTPLEQRPDMSDDPTKFRSKYFRVPFIDDRPTAGYTPDNSSTILISTEAPPEVVLRAVVDECYHLFQDAEHGRGWRAKNRVLADAQADEFARSQQDRILAALDKTS